MTSVIISLAGHIDHGKSSLLNAINPFYADRRAEEQKRAITINLGFNYLFTTDYELFFIDMPGHTDYLPNMLKGIINADIAILTIDAFEGVKEQTLEHAFIISKSKCQKVIFAITKIDKVDENRLNDLTVTVSDLAKRHNIDDFSITYTSIHHDNTIANIKKAIISNISKIKAKYDNTHTRMFIDRSFIIDGAGVIITGSIDNGKISIKDNFTLYPISKKCKVKALQITGNNRETATINERTAVNISAVEIKEAKHATILYDEIFYTLYKRYQIELYINPDTNIEIISSKKYNFIIGAINIMGRIIIDKNLIIFDKDIPLIKDDILYLRAGSIPKTIASIKILAPNIKKDKKHTVKINTTQIADKQFIEADIILNFINLADEIISFDDIITTVTIDKTITKKAISYLINKDKIIYLKSDRYISINKFQFYLDMINNAIDSGILVDLAYFRKATLLSREKSIIILDKLDSSRDKNGLANWQIKDMKRFKDTTIK